MNKLNIINYLTQEIELELELLNQYENIKNIYYKTEETDKSYEVIQTKFYNAKVPSKSKAKEYLKMIRRLSLEVEKELKV